MNFPTPAPGNVNCRNCGRVNLKGCATCGRCRECQCRCKACGNCLELHFKFCRHCARCKRPTANKGKELFKCTCRTRPKFHMFDKIRTHPTKLFRLVRLRRPIGLEIELSDVGGDTHNMGRMYTYGHQWTHDGSITAGGLELILNPLVGQQLPDALTYWTNMFKRCNSVADASCGYHVHVGAGEWSAYELRRLLMLYSKFESLFYDLVAPGRDKSRIVRGEPKWYCKRLAWSEAWHSQLWRLQRSADIRRFLIESLYPHYIGRTKGKRIDMRQIRRHKYEPCRYFGLNLHTWFERGTVEYRHHEGTVDRETLLYWALFCGWFTEFASALSDSQIHQINTLDDLLYRTWKTGTGPLFMPSDVSAWVRNTLASRAEALRVLAALGVEKKKVKV